MALYTVIFDYRGGTYISQTQAENQSSALRLWARDLDITQVQYLGESRKQKLISEIERDFSNGLIPMALTGLQNAWCAGVYLGSGLVNIIKTALL